MRKIPAVEEAKALMLEAKDWSVWHWLMQKGRVRATADKATAALAELEENVKSGWSEDLSKAAGNGKVRGVDAELRAALDAFREANEAAENARLDAEATFDEAERRLSASMAREGAQKAIDSWQMREKAIRKAEAVAKKQSPR